MIAVDTNILLNARRKELPKHGTALAALRSLAEGDVPWGLPLDCTVEFLRVVTHHKVFDPPTSPADATRFIEALLRSPTVRLLKPGEQFWQIFAKLINEGEIQGNMVFDAKIAAVCLENGANEILTEDRDFHQFKAVRVTRLEKR